MSSSPRKFARSPARADRRIDDLLPYRLNRLVDLWNRRLEQRLRDFDCTFAEWRVLAILAGRDGIAMSEVVTRTMIQQSTVSRLIARMVDAGLIGRRVAPQDRRAVTLRLTAKGEAMFDRIWQVAVEHAALCTDGIGARDLADLSRALDKLVDAVEA